MSLSKTDSSSFTDWHYVETPNPNLVCAICTYPFHHPVMLQCSHTFCSECIDASLKLRRQCPTCRVPCTAPPERAPLALRNLVDELQVHCPYAPCRARGQRQWMRQQHLDSCFFHPEAAKECACSTHARKIEAFETQLAALQEDHQRLSQRLDAIERDVAQALPNLSALECRYYDCVHETHLHRGEMAHFKMEVMEGCASMHSEVQAIRRACMAVSDIMQKWVKEKGMRVPKEKKL